MFTRNLIKRSLVAGLAIGAASLPAVGDARPWTIHSRQS